jgi:hypothetical protein
MRFDKRIVLVTGAASGIGLGSPPLATRPQDLALSESPDPNDPESPPLATSTPARTPRGI